MGMGEPLANYDPTWAAVQRLHDDLGLSARHLTVSTVGVVPGIRRLAAEALPVNLAVSLHAADDELRDELVPDQPALPAEPLMDACAGYSRPPAAGCRSSGRSSTASTTDRATPGSSPTLAPARCGPTSTSSRSTPRPATPCGAHRRRVRAFRDLLRAGGVNATVRRTRGTDIDAACGQLRAGHEDADPPPPRRPAAARAPEPRSLSAPGPSRARPGRSTSTSPATTAAPHTTLRLTGPRPPRRVHHRRAAAAARLASR